MQNNSLRVRLHRYKRNLLFPLFLFFFVFSNFIGYTVITPPEEETEKDIDCSISDWGGKDTMSTSTDNGRDATHEDSLRFGLI